MQSWHYSSSETDEPIWYIDQKPMRILQNDEQALERVKRRLPKECELLNQPTKLLQPSALQYASKPEMRKIQREIGRGADYSIFFDPYLVADDDTDHSKFRSLSLLECIPNAVDEDSKEILPPRGILPAYANYSYAGQSNTMSRKAKPVLIYIAQRICHKIVNSSIGRPIANVSDWLKHIAVKGQLPPSPCPNLTRFPIIKVTCSVSDLAIPDVGEELADEMRATDPRLRLDPSSGRMFLKKKDSASLLARGVLSKKQTLFDSSLCTGETPYLVLRKCAICITKATTVNTSRKNENNSIPFWITQKNDTHVSRQEQGGTTLEPKPQRTSTCDPNQTILLNTQNRCEVSASEILGLSLEDTLSFECAAVLDAAWADDTSVTTMANPNLSRKMSSSFKIGLYHFGYFRPYLHKWDAALRDCVESVSKNAQDANEQIALTDSRLPSPIGQSINIISPSSPDLKPYYNSPAINSMPFIKGNEIDLLGSDSFVIDDKADTFGGVKQKLFETMKRCYESEILAVRKITTEEFRKKIKDFIPTIVKEYVERSSRTQKKKLLLKHQTNEEQTSALQGGFARKRVCAICLLEINRPSPFSGNESAEENYQKSDRLTFFGCCGIMPCPSIQTNPEMNDTSLKHYGSDTSCARVAHTACLNPVYEVVADRVGVLGTAPSDIAPLLSCQKRKEQRVLLPKLMENLRVRKTQPWISNKAEFGSQNPETITRKSIAAEMRKALQEVEDDFEGDDEQSPKDSDGEELEAQNDSQRLIVASRSDWDSAVAWISPRNPSSFYSIESIQKLLLRGSSKQNASPAAWGGLKQLEAGRFVAWGSWQCGLCAKSQIELVINAQNIEDSSNEERMLKSNSVLDVVHDKPKKRVTKVDRYDNYTSYDESESSSSSSSDSSDGETYSKVRRATVSKPSSNLFGKRRFGRSRIQEQISDDDYDFGSESEDESNSPHELKTTLQKEQAKLDSLSSTTSRKRTKRSAPVQELVPEKLEDKVKGVDDAEMGLQAASIILRVSRGLLRADPMEEERKKMRKRLGNTSKQVKGAQLHSEEQSNVEKRRDDKEDEYESDEYSEHEKVDVKLKEVKMTAWGTSETPLSSRTMISKLLKHMSSHESHSNSRDEQEESDFKMLTNAEKLPEFLFAAHKQASEKQKRRTARRLKQQPTLNSEAAQASSQAQINETEDHPTDDAMHENKEDGEKPLVEAVEDSSNTLSVMDARTAAILDAGFRYLTASEIDAVHTTYEIISKPDSNSGTTSDLKAVGGKKVLDHVSSRLGKVIAPKSGGSKETNTKLKYGEGLDQMIDETSKVLSILDPHVVTQVVMASIAKSQVSDYESLQNVLLDSRGGIQDGYTISKVLFDMLKKHKRLASQIRSLLENTLTMGAVSEMQSLSEFWDSQLVSTKNVIGSAWTQGTPYAASSSFTGAGVRTDKCVLIPPQEVANDSTDLESDYFQPRSPTKLLPLEIVRAMHMQWQMKRAIELSAHAVSRRSEASNSNTSKNVLSKQDQPHIVISDSAESSDILQFRAKRSEQRRLGRLGSDMNLGGTTLQNMQKRLRFRRSLIHDFGVFCEEHVNPGEVVVEYLGEYVKLKDADRREELYAQLGIGSSYMFRVDRKYLIDATRKGNIARFINHSCDPNCSAKVLNKRILIMAKKEINPGDELTYDYKFPIEATNKIPCLCGTSKCRGFLN